MIHANVLMPKPILQEVAQLPLMILPITSHAFIQYQIMVIRREFTSAKCVRQFGKLKLVTRTDHHL